METLFLMETLFRNWKMFFCFSLLTKSLSALSFAGPPPTMECNLCERQTQHHFCIGCRKSTALTASPQVDSLLFHLPTRCPNHTLVITILPTLSQLFVHFLFHFLLRFFVHSQPRLFSNNNFSQSNESMYEPTKQI